LKGTAYDPVHYQEGYPEGIEHHFWNLARNHVILRRLRRYSVPSQRVLEIGCGRGIVVEYLRAHGIDCHGCELAAIEVPPTLCPWVRTACDAFELDAEQRRAADVLLLLDVIEHLDDPQDFLRRTLEAFPGAARLLVTVPARPELWSNFDHYYGHRCRFTLATLRELVGGLPLRELDCGYFFHALYPLMYLASRMGRDREVVLRAPRLATLHALLSRMLSLEERVLPPNWIGTSIVGSYAIEDRG